MAIGETLEAVAVRRDGTKGVPGGREGSVEGGNHVAIAADPRVTRAINAKAAPMEFPAGRAGTQVTQKQCVAQKRRMR